MIQETVLVSLVSLAGAIVGHLTGLWTNQQSGAVQLLTEYRSMFSELREELADCKTDRDYLDTVLRGIAAEVLTPEQQAKLLRARPFVERSNPKDGHS